MNTGIEIFCLCLFGALVAIILSTSWGSILVAWISELSAWKNKNVFRDKFAQQITRLSIWSLIWGVVLMFGIIHLTIQVVPQWGRLITNLPGKALLYPSLLLSSGLLLILFYLLLWKKMKKKKPWHLGLGLLSMLSLWAGVYSFFNIKMGLISGYPQIVPTPGLWRICWLPVLSTKWLLFLGHFLLLALGGSGLLGLLFLLLRRKKDNFGRDYYRYAVPLAAKWALPFALQVIPMILALFLYFRPDKSPIAIELIFITTIISCLCFLFPIWLLIKVVQHDTPLRLKGTMILSVIMSWIALSGCSFIYLCLFQVDLVQKAFF